MDSARYLLVFGVILALLCGIVPVSADEIFNHVYEESVYETFLTQIDTLGLFGFEEVDSIFLPADINEEKVPHIFAQIPKNYVTAYISLKDSDGWNVLITNYDGTEVYGTGYFGFFKYIAGGNEYLQIYMDIYELDTPTSQAYRLSAAPSGSIYPTIGVCRRSVTPSQATYAQFESACTVIEMPNYALSFSGGIDSSHRAWPSRSPQYNVYIDIWKNQLIINQNINRLDIDIVKNFTGFNTYSDHIISFGETSYTVYNTNTNYSAYVFEDFYPVDVKIKSLMSGTWYNTTCGLDIPPTPTPTPIPTPSNTYTAKIEARDYHTHEILPDVHFLVVDFPKYEIPGQSPTLYSDWVSSGILEIPLEYRAYDDPNFPRQYGIRASKQGYYADDIIVSHWTGPYTFIVRMRNITAEQPLDTSLITFHIKEIFTGNYINNARLIISHYSEGEVYNQTVIGGIQAVRLAQTQPYDPDFDYTVEVKADGYNDFTMGMSVLEDRPITILMYPGDEIPDEGNAFLHFKVYYFDNQDISHDISGVKITIAGQTKYTNNAGAVTFELPVSDILYHYTAEHPEFYTQSGSILLQDNRIHYVQMHHREVPTTPTAQPTFPGEEPADESYLDWMARNFATAFNLSLEGGKLFMGMIISLAIGMITAKKLNGGAAEFGIGMLGGMVLCILIGILPLWPIIALLLIVGLYIGMQIARGYTHVGR